MASVHKYEPTRFVLDDDGEKIPHPDRPGKFLTEKTGKVIWRARYQDAAKREITKQFRRKVDAQAWLDGITTSKVTGQYVDPRAGKVTFREYAEGWRARQLYRPSTAEVVRIALTGRVYPLIGDLPLQAITRDHVVGMVKDLADEFAPSTVEVTYSYVATVLRSAVESKVIAVTPATNIAMPEKHAVKVVPMSVAEVFALVDAMTDRYRAMVLLAAGTGMRQGEVFGLTWDRVDLENGVVTVDRQLVKVEAGEPVYGPPKTPTSVRDIPLPDVVADALREHLEAFPVGESGLVFTVPGGTPMRKSSFWTVWKRATRDAEIAGRGFHDLRHHYASLLIRHGESVKVVQARLGHKSAQETLDTYSHLWPDSDARTRRAVDSALVRPSDFPPTSPDQGRPNPR